MLVILLYGAVAVVVSYLLAIKGWGILIPVYLLILGFVFLRQRPWDKKKFVWYLEEKNPHLKERLISLYELVERGIKHPSLERLKRELAKLDVSYPISWRFILPPLLVAAFFSLPAAVRFPRKPQAKFHPHKMRLLEGDSLLIVFQEGDTLTVWLYGSNDAHNIKLPQISDDQLLFILKNGKRYEFNVKGSGWLSGIPAGRYRLQVKGFSGEAYVEVLPRPVLYAIKGFIVPPAYTGIGKMPIRRENVTYEGSTFSQLRIEHSGDSAKFLNLPDTLKRDVEVRVEVFRNGRGFRYVAFRVKVLKDEPPKVVIQPSGMVRAEGEELPAVVSAYDDIGLKEVGMFILRNGERKREILGPEKRTPAASYDLLFTLGDTLTVIAYAVDVAGKMSLSDTLFVLPRSPEEVLKEKLLSRKGDEVKDLEKRLKELQEELEVSQELDEVLRRDISEAIKESERTYRDIKEALERIVSQVRDPEIARLSMELQRLLKESLDEEMDRTLKELQKAMREVDPKKVAEALKKLRMDQRKLREELERFRKILERYVQEKKLKELGERLEDLAIKQAKLEGKRSRYEQAKLRRELEELRRTLDSLRKSFDLNTASLKEVDSLLKEAQAHMGRALQRMEGGGNFTRNQSQAKENLQKAADLLQKTYKNLVESRKKELVKELNEVADASVFTDLRLEREADVSTIQKAQEVVLEMETNLKEMAQKSVFVSSRLHRLARRVYNELEAAREELEDGDRKGAQAHIKNAQSMLRMLALMSSSSAQACQNSGGSTGVEAYMRQLARMAGEQKSISQQLGGNMSSELLAEMLARQMALRKALEGMLEGMRKEGMPSDVLKKLEEAVEKMRELEREMSSENALENAERIRRKAHRITVRLLEARKALRRQRTEPKYEARRPKPYKVVGRRIRPLIDKRRIAEIYRKILNGEKLSPEEREAYRRYMEEVLR